MNFQTEIKISSERFKKLDIEAIKNISKQYKFSYLDILSVAYAESSFKPNTIHPVSNAAGMYQMKPWAIDRTGLKNINIYDPVEATHAATKFLHILRNVDYPKIKNIQPPQTINNFEKLMLLYHYGLRGTVERLNMKDFPKETKIYISNLRKGYKIAFNILSKKK